MWAFFLLSLWNWSKFLTEKIGTFQAKNDQKWTKNERKKNTICNDDFGQKWKKCVKILGNLRKTWKFEVGWEAFMDVNLGWFWTGYWGSFWGWGPIRVKKCLKCLRNGRCSKDVFVSSWLGTSMQQHGVLQVQCKAKWTQHHTNCSWVHVWITVAKLSNGNRSRWSQ